jgi:hypothetical protein
MNIKEVSTFNLVSGNKNTVLSNNNISNQNSHNSISTKKTSD